MINTDIKYSNIVLKYMLCVCVCNKHFYVSLIFLVAGISSRR